MAAGDRRVVRRRRPVRRRGIARWSRARRGVARCRLARQQAERLRRLPRRRRSPRRRRPHQPAAAGDRRQVERWAARRRGADAAAGPVPGGRVRGAVARHGPLPPVPHRQAVDVGVRRSRRSPRSSPGCTPTPRTTTSSTGRAIRRRSCRRRKAILGSTRCTPARWWRSCRPRRRAGTSGRSCSPRRVAPVTVSASRCRSAPTSSPTP